MSWSLLAVRYPACTADCRLIQDPDGSVLYVRSQYEEILRRHQRCSYADLAAATGEARLHKRGLARWRERVGMTLPEARAARRFFLKRYHQPPLRQQLRRLLAGYASTAAVEWHWLHLIGGLGIAVPTPVAYGASLAGWKERGSLLLTEEVPGESLDNWIPAAVRRGGLGRRVRGVLVERTAQLVARLHHADVVHRDLYLAHLFVHAAGDGDYELTLIDLQRVLAPRWRRRRWIVKDLASLNYSTPFAAAGRTDRLRFMLRYLSEDRLSRRSKELIRAIVRKTERIARHSSKHELG